MLLIILNVIITVHVLHFHSYVVKEKYVVYFLLILKEIAKSLLELVINQLAMCQLHLSECS